MSVFGDLDLRLDPWQVEYGSELPLGTPAEEADRESVLPEVEPHRRVGPHPSQPHGPAGPAAPPPHLH
jgi:hypothetical protein